MASKLRSGRRSQDKGIPRGVPSARELPARGPGGARCKGGVSSSQALAWKWRTCRLDTDDQLHLVARGRTPSVEHRKGLSTDARHRDGAVRSSDEGPVMGSEQRGRAGQVILRSTLLGRSRWSNQDRR
jgi:hypothetical protein